MTTRHSRLINAFRPGAEIDLPSLFAGRSTEITRLVDALHSDGACPVIYGGRGLGKSSLAVQLQRIALGDVELLGDLDIEERAFSEDERFVAIFISCSDATTNLHAVLQRVINQTEEIVVDWQRELDSPRLKSRTRRTKFTAKIFETETTKQFEEEVTKPKYTSLDLEERVVELGRILSAVTGRRVVFIVDELDRVRDTSGLASFLKSASSAELRFVLVGIAQNLSGLIEDHQSLERIAIPVQVRPMTRRELVEVVEKATGQLEFVGVHVSFSDRAARKLAKVANGFPWFVHVIGQQALLGAEFDGLNVVDVRHVDAAMHDLTGNRFAQRFADLYQQAVRDSWNREAVLRCFAAWNGQDIPTKDVYRVAEKLGVGNPSVYKGHLGREKYGRILEAPPFQERGAVRFANDMFKVYVGIRPSLYTDLDDDVRAAWKER